MTQNTSRKSPPSPDEGAAYTAAVMDRVKAMRQARGWSAEQLAAEMNDAGIPWTRDTVVNLENGRRKRIAAHELLVLAYVLDCDSPVELLVPVTAASMPFTPKTDVATLDAVMWCRGQTGPLRAWLNAEPAERDAVRARLFNRADAAAQAAMSARRAAGGN